MSFLEANNALRDIIYSENELLACVDFETATQVAKTLFWEAVRLHLDLSHCQSSQVTDQLNKEFYGLISEDMDIAEARNIFDNDHSNYESEYVHFLCEFVTHSMALFHNLNANGPTS